MTYMPFNRVRRKLNTGIVLLPPYNLEIESMGFKDIGNIFLRDPKCRMWCMGMFCINSYLEQICRSNCTVPKQAILERRKLTDKDLCAWEPGRIRCTWPKFSGASGPPDKLEDRRIATKGTEGVDIEANLRKVIESIVNNSQKRDNVMKAIEESLENLHIEVPILGFEYATVRGDIRYEMEFPCSFFHCVEGVLNAFFEGTGLVFDLEDMTKTEIFADAKLFHQVNARVQSDSFKKHIFPGEQSSQETTCERPAAPPETFKLRTSQEGDSKKIREENQNKIPPIVTLLVGKEGQCELGAGYGVLQNCGIELPKYINLNNYTDDPSEETKTKLCRMCRLYHYRTTDECVKVAMDRHSMYTMVFDYTFWQINRLSSEPNFLKWGGGDHLNRLAVANFNEDDFNEYPEMKFDRSRIFFNEDKDPDVFYQVVCNVINSLFETIPELQDEDFLKRIMNRRTEDGPEESVVRLFNDRIQRTIRDRAPLFQEYHTNYKKYHNPDMDPDISELLQKLPSRDINSYVIISDLSNATQEAYLVEVDEYEFDLLFFPVRKRRINGGDYAELRHCIPEFKHSVSVFKKLEECEHAAKMYDYGKMEYIDEYGNEQVKLFILKEKAHGAVAKIFFNRDGEIIEEKTDYEHLDLVENAMSDLTDYCSREELDKSLLVDKTFPSLYACLCEEGLYGEQQIRDLRAAGVDIKPDFRIIDGSYAKLFGYVTDMKISLAQGFTWVNGRTI